MPVLRGIAVLLGVMVTMPYLVEPLPSWGCACERRLDRYFGQPGTSLTQAPRAAHTFELASQSKRQSSDALGSLLVEGANEQDEEASQSSRTCRRASAGSLSSAMASRSVDGVVSVLKVRLSSVRTLSSCCWTAAAALTGAIFSGTDEATGRR